MRFQEGRWRWRQDDYDREEEFKVDVEDKEIDTKGSYSLQLYFKLSPFHSSVVGWLRMMDVIKC